MDGHLVKVLTVITYIKFKNLPDSITIFFSICPIPLDFTLSR